MPTFDIAYNGPKGLYEVHAQGCKHIAMSLERMTTVQAPTGEDAAAEYERDNEGIFGTKIGPCARMKAHKPVVVTSGDSSRPAYCRVCGVPTKTTFSKNGSHPVSHDKADPRRYPILDDDLKPVTDDSEVKP